MLVVCSLEGSFGASPRLFRSPQYHLGFFELRGHTLLLNHHTILVLAILQSNEVDHPNRHMALILNDSLRILDLMNCLCGSLQLAAS